MNSCHDISFLKRWFGWWYLNVWEPWLPKHSNWHHFRVVLFDGRWVKLRDKRIRSKSVLKKNILKPHIFPPRHVFYSVLRWLDPKNIGPKRVRAYCLGGPLLFDIDVMNVFSYDEDTLDEAKRQTLALADFITDELGYTDFLFVFTGRRGFHVYVQDFDITDFIHDFDPLHREKYEGRVRKYMAELVLKRGFKIDAQVTCDTRRVVRLPNTLHGETGLRALPLSRDQFEKFRIEDAIVFPLDSCARVKMTKTVAFRQMPFSETIHIDSNGIASMPIAIAIMFIASGYATLLENES